MAEIIRAKPNEDGKVVIKLFKNDIDVTKFVKDGVALVSLYGKDYEVRVASEKKTIKVKKAKDNGKQVDVGFIESPDED